MVTAGLYLHWTVVASVARLHGYCRFVSTLDSLLSLASVARLHGYCRFVSTLDSLLSLASVARLHGYCRFDLYLHWTVDSLFTLSSICSQTSSW